MAAMLLNAFIRKDYDLIGFVDGGQPVRYHQGRPSARELFKRRSGGLGFR